jgi:hypothetical protein
MALPAPLAAGVAAQRGSRNCPGPARAPILHNPFRTTFPVPLSSHLVVFDRELAALDG